MEEGWRGASLGAVDNQEEEKRTWCGDSSPRDSDAAVDLLVFFNSLTKAAKVSATRRSVHWIQGEGEGWVGVVGGL